MKGYTFLPYYRSTYRYASGVLASGVHSIHRLPASIRDKVINFPEIGFHPKEFKVLPKRKPQQMTVLFVGRLVPLKLPDILIQAFSQSKILRRHKLIVVGDGPEYRRLQELVHVHHLQDCVQLTGEVAHDQVARFMQTSNIFAFPSVHELTGGVIVEAMACGLACVVVDYGGPAEIVHKDFGVKVPFGDTKLVTRGFKQELERLVVNYDLVRQMGERASRYVVKYYTWEAKAKKTVETYKWLLGKCPKPYYWN